MSGLRWKVDHRPKVQKQVHAVAVKAQNEFGEHILNESNEVVPLEEATLQRSGIVDTDDKNIRTAISYDTPYAIRQHEDPELHHDSGRTDKFLEHSLKNNANQYGPHMQKAIKRVIS